MGGEREERREGTRETLCEGESKEKLPEKETAAIQKQKPHHPQDPQSKNFF